MRSDIGVSLKGVGMRFVVSRSDDRSIQGIFRSFRRRSEVRVVDALESINLEIGRGDRIGLIGANGAGKSTLLKVMAGIYFPTSGEAVIRGRVSPLFEFATGFEMELSGWENIRIRGMLLGMKPREIEAKLGEIGDFSGLGEFLDFPVRTYSVGMFVRLAFSVSTAVNPQILLLDEVIGAGDREFAGKAKARMLKLIEHGEIVVLASHALAEVAEICSKVIWLDRGCVQLFGPSAEVIEAYEASADARGAVPDVPAVVVQA